MEKVEVPPEREEAAQQWPPPHCSFYRVYALPRIKGSAAYEQDQRLSRIPWGETPVHIGLRAAEADAELE